MLFKHVICHVDHTQKVPFHNAQLCWQALQEAQGFIGQCGGWEESSEMLSAHIFAFWESEAAYQQFMEFLHDEIYFRSNQKETFNKIEVLFKQMDMLPKNKEDMVEVIKDETGKLSNFTLVEEWNIFGKAAFT